jgi:hypothetical protein
MWGVGGSITGSKAWSDSTSRTNEDTWSKQQKETAKKLGNYINPNIGEGSPSYSGARVAGMSSPERGSMAWLQSYLNQGAPQQYNMANRQLSNVMNNNYSSAIVDPTQTRSLYDWAQGQALGTMEGAQSKDIVSDQATTDLYKRMVDQVLKRDLPGLQNTVANNANLRGMYFSGGHEGMQTDLLKDAQSNLLDTLANLRYGDEQARRDLEATREARRYDTLGNVLNTGYGQQYGDIQTSQDIGREREGRQFSAIPLAMDMGTTQDELALNRVAAGQQYGELPRTLEQQQLDTNFSEFLRTLPENSPLLQYALDYLNAQGTKKSKTKTDETQTGLASKVSASYGMPQNT